MKINLLYTSSDYQWKLGIFLTIYKSSNIYKRRNGPSKTIHNPNNPKPDILPLNIRLARPNRILWRLPEITHRMGRILIINPLIDIKMSHPRNGVNNSQALQRVDGDWIGFWTNAFWSFEKVFERRERVQGGDGLSNGSKKYREWVFWREEKVQVLWKVCQRAPQSGKISPSAAGSHVDRKGQEARQLLQGILWVLLPLRTAPIRNRLHNLPPSFNRSNDPFRPRGHRILCVNWNSWYTCVEPGRIGH